jgi:hypothetical protein
VHSAKFERCVKAVKRKGGARNPWAACHASLGRKAFAKRDPGILNDRRGERPGGYYAYGFVIATDTFLSGWGQAQGGKSYYAIEVENETEAYIVMDNLKHRGDMKRIRFVKTLKNIRLGPRDHLSVTDKFNAPRYFQEGSFAEEEGGRKRGRGRRDPVRRGTRRRHPRRDPADFSQTMYEANEVASFRKDLALVEKGEAQNEIDEWKEALAHDPALVAERIGWIINGSYGYGAMLQAKQRINQRGNAPAWLTQVVGALEWGVPFASTRKAWNALNPRQKAALDKHVKHIIDVSKKEGW